MNIYFSPHPDDAILSCGGTMLKTKKKQLVVNVFCGDYLQPTAWDQLCEIEGSPMRERVSEDQKILNELGVDVVYLDFLDSAAIGKKRRDIFSIEKQILKIVDSYQGDFFFPLGVGHPDHLTLKKIGGKVEGAKYYADIPYVFDKKLREPDIKTDISRYIDRKIDLVFKYKTQLKGLLHLIGMGEESKLKKRIKDYHFEDGAYYENFYLE